MPATPPEICPVCGASVPRTALACPECGADERSGWKEDPDDGLDLPDEEFDYDAFIAEEFGGEPRHRIRPIWIVAAIVAFAAFAAALFLGFF